MLADARLRSSLFILVVAAPPEALFVAAFRRAVEPLVHAPEAVQSASVCGVGVIEDAVLEHESAHARSLARVGRRISTGGGCEGVSPFGAFFPWPFARVVVLDAFLALLFLGEPNAEVGVEVVSERRRPGKCPSQPLLVRLQL